MHIAIHKPAEIGDSGLSGINKSTDDIHTAEDENTCKTVLYLQFCDWLETPPGLSGHTVNILFMKNNFIIKRQFT